MLRLPMPHRFEVTELPQASIPVAGGARGEHAGDDDVEHDDARKGPQHDPQHARTLPGRAPHAQRVIVPTERPRRGLRGYAPPMPSTTRCRAWNTGRRASVRTSHHPNAVNATATTISRNVRAMIASAREPGSGSRVRPSNNSHRGAGSLHMRRASPFRGASEPDVRLFAPPEALGRSDAHAIFTTSASPGTSDALVTKMC